MFGGFHGHVEDRPATHHLRCREIGDVPVFAVPPPDRARGFDRGPPEVAPLPGFQVQHGKPGFEPAGIELRGGPGQHRERPVVLTAGDTDDVLVDQRPDLPGPPIETPEPRRAEALAPDPDGHGGCLVLGDEHDPFTHREERGDLAPPGEQRPVHRVDQAVPEEVEGVRRPFGHGALGQPPGFLATVDGREPDLGNGVRDGVDLVGDPPPVSGKRGIRRDSAVGDQLSGQHVFILPTKPSPVRRASIRFPARARPVLPVRRGRCPARSASGGCRPPRVRAAPS